VTGAPAHPVRVLYIAGSGRSGSTILERILGNTSGFVSVGEVRRFWEFVSSPDRLCGCGEKMEACGFWRQILDAGEIPRDIVLEHAPIAARLDRMMNAPFLALGFPRSRQIPESLVTWTGRLYRSIRDRAGGSIIVDSSKSAAHLHVLLRVPALELHVLHLVRDPRAYVYAQTKRRKPEQRAGGTRVTMRSLPLGLAVVAWITENVFSTRWGKNAAGYARMRYEDFVARPADTLDATLSQLGLPDVTRPELGRGPLTLGPTHSVAGNPNRLETGPVILTEDREWMTKMPGLTRAALGVAFLPWMGRYGYSLTPEASQRGLHGVERRA
jgi:hypothetical protein